MRRFVTAVFTIALLAAACSSSDDSGEDSLPADDPGVTPDGTIEPDPEPEETVPPTTDTIPPEATELPTIQIVFVEFGENGFVEIANVGDEPADVNGIQFCQFPTYFDLGPVAGGTIAPGESIQLWESL